MELFFDCLIQNCLEKLLFDEIKGEPRYLDTKGLCPVSINLKNGIVQITSDLSMTLDFDSGRRKMEISKDGQRITIKKLIPEVSTNIYAYQSLPPKYNSLYNYALHICDVLKAKLPSCSFENSDGQFLLRKNGKDSSFEAKFFSGVTLQLDLDGELLEFKRSTPGSSIMDVELANIGVFPDEVKKYMVKAREYLKVAVQLNSQGN